MARLTGSSILRALNLSSVPTSAAYGTLASQCALMPDAARRSYLRWVTAEAAHDPGLALLVAPVLVAAADSRLLVVTVLASPEHEPLLKSWLEAVAALRLAALVFADGAPALQAAERAASHLAAVSALPGDPGSPLLARKWDAVAQLLSLGGVGVLYADVDTLLLSPPSVWLHGDSDVEALSEAWDDEGARGFIFGSDDPSMGWGRYAESMRIAFVSASLLWLQPTHEARALATELARQARSQRWRTAPGAAWQLDAGGDGGCCAADDSGDADAAEAAGLTFALFGPAHDDVRRVGASVRIVHRECALNARVSGATLAQRAASRTRPATVQLGRFDGAEAAARRARAAVGLFHGGRPSEAVGGDASDPLGPSWQLGQVLPWRHGVERTRVDALMGAPLVWNATRAKVLQTHCRVPRREVADERAATSRPLHWLVPEGASEWPVNCEGGKEELCAVVRRVAKARAVMACVSNGRIAVDSYLGQFVDMVKRAGVTNFLVAALDQKTSDYLTPKGTPHFVRRLKTRSGKDSSTTDNHDTSALKFGLLAEMLSIGVSVLLSDVDVVVLSDPFVALHRDTDVEGMTDGWDDASAYGFVHTLPLAGSAHGPLRSLRLETRNSGLFYLAATNESLRLMQMLASRLGREQIWDQSAYNLETFLLAYGAAPTAGVTYRVMNYLCVLNTKVLFRYLKKDPQLNSPSKFVPAMAHMNYHPEKGERMAATIGFYVKGDERALHAWNGGEGKNTSGCNGKLGVTTSEMPPPFTPARLQQHNLARNLNASGEAWEWAGRGPLRFLPDGTAPSPWGPASWGPVPSVWRNDSVHVQLGGETYLLMFLSEKWSFVAVRCSDEVVSYGRLARQPVPEQLLRW